jgi:hypothetical protein
MPGLLELAHLGRRPNVIALAVLPECPWQHRICARLTPEHESARTVAATANVKRPAQWQRLRRGGVAHAARQICPPRMARPNHPPSAVGVVTILSP